MHEQAQCNSLKTTTISCDSGHLSLPLSCLSATMLNVFIKQQILWKPTMRFSSLKGRWIIIELTLQKVMRFVIPSIRKYELLT